MERGMDWDEILRGFWRGFCAGLFLAVLGYGVWSSCSSTSGDSPSHPPSSAATDSAVSASN